jgi:serine O-acetyltransferase
VAKKPKKRGKGLWADLQRVYDNYEEHSYTEDPPDEPFQEKWEKTGERAAMVFLGMPIWPMLLFRLRVYLYKNEVPVLPYICDRLSTMLWRVTIGRFVTIGERLFIAHGEVVIDGRVVLGDDVVLSPWVTIGLAGRRKIGFDPRGPIIGNRVFIGTGSKVLGPITIGDDVRIGANSVVIDDVPANCTVVGAPARIVHTTRPFEEWGR